VLHQGQHHEVHGRLVPPDVLTRSRPSIPRSNTSTGSSTSGCQDGRYAQAFDVLVIAESLRRRSLGRRRSNHRFRGARRFGEHRRSLFDVEAIHGLRTASRRPEPRQPVGPLHGAILMLVHIGESDVAERFTTGGCERLKTDCTRTTFIKRHVKRESRYERVRRCGDRALRQKSQATSSPSNMRRAPHMISQSGPRAPRRRRARAGVDLFIDRRTAIPKSSLRRCSDSASKARGLTTISNRGTNLAHGNPDTYWSDHWSCD